MGTKVIGKIVLYELMDQDKMTDLLSGTDTVVFEIQRNYDLGDIPANMVAVLPTQFNDVTVDYNLALKNVLDIASWIHLENAVVYKIKYNDSLKQFDLTNSYIRDSKSTSGPLTVIPTGQNIKAAFITPGLDAPVTTIIDLPYNDLISSTDRAAMTAVGLELDLAITGSLFTFKTQSVPYKVVFYKPDTAVENYVIDFELQNKTIEK